MSINLLAVSALANVRYSTPYGHSLPLSQSLNANHSGGKDTLSSSCDKFMGLNPDAIAAQTYNYEPEGFVRAISGQGAIHCSGM
jgi:hypothetical protein